MHSLARRYIKTAILFLGLGLAIGFWMVVARDIGGQSPTPLLITAHTHSILVGFVMMMILGVALWLLPRPERGDEQYSPQRADVAYWLLTGGTLARTAGEVVRAILTSSPDTPLALATVAGAILQIAGLSLFFYTVWGRIRSAGSREREARGERF